MDRDVTRRVRPALAESGPACSDEELMARFQRGEASAFDAILDRHKRGIYAYLRRSSASAADADDRFQEVFLKVIKAAPAWEPQAKLTTWLYTVARNVLIDAARRRKTRGLDLPLEGDPSDERPAPADRLTDGTLPADQALLEREHGSAVEALVAGLPGEQREVFLLKRDGLTFDEIAEVTGSSRNTAKSRLRYALEKLRAGLETRGLVDGRPPRGRGLR